MAEEGSDIKMLGNYAVAVVVLAVIVVLGIAILGAFKATGLITNTTVDLFITGLVTFGTFIGLIVLAAIGKIIIKMFRHGL
jgi:hypothetical protein